jgi:hypothetical protein
MKQVLLAAAAVAFLAIAVLPVSKADEWDKKTIITVNEPILVPGKELQPGKYVMKLLNSPSDRHIVQIFNEDQTQLQATILAFNNYKLTPSDKTELTYWETPAGSPPALRAWFYPGDNFGQEFAYPKDMAEKIAAQNNNAKVPSYDNGSTLTAENAKDVTVNDRPADLEVKTRETAEAVGHGVKKAGEEIKEGAEKTGEAIKNTTERAANAVADRVDPDRHEDVAAAPAPAPTPAPAEPVQTAQVTPTPAPAPANTTTEPTELPRTASPMPWVLAMGLASLLSAGALRAANRS